MSKQEIYAWSSVGFTLAIVGFYLVSVFGWPTGLENYAEYFTDLFWKVIGITFLVEFTLGIMKSTKWGGVFKDERDKQIEAKGFRNAYYFLMVAIATLIANVLISDMLTEHRGEPLLLSMPFMTFHVLVVILLSANLLKSGTQLFYYRKGE
ncbi:hypothetical protein NC796_22165 [Aliifodinibius sp. S!AR15-10]|uniref:hypothetical protein n=1 Tax=Aliifodinibius sp. S!AR15-10 TaxID=2950437 RepID=UPI0028582C1E|nr:hypothetical protein [Aliifodinibius sp. S!AR15-10]MDR8393875.1 hypothetical protein [Aliifodinibius sp. S!AR15-10]